MLTPITTVPNTSGSNSAPAPMPSNGPQSGARAWGQRWGLHTPGSLLRRARELNTSNYLVEGLIPARSIGLLLGDSGLGKSPLVYQLGISVATGTPFFGHATHKDRVVIADFENGIHHALELVKSISRYLGLPGPPDDENLLIWTLNDCTPRFGQPNHTLLEMLREVHPTLAIIDSLGSSTPEAEEKNSAATRMLQEYRRLAREHGTATYFVHHRRKEPRKKAESAGPLEDTNLRRWFQDARGASALINGSDVRLGVDEPDLSAVQKDDVVLVLRGFGRVRGEIGPLYLARDFDEEQRPLGYRCLVGPELLFNTEQEGAYKSLPLKFTFSEAKRAYSKSDQPTRNWLVRMENLKLVRRVGRGMYEKLSPKGDRRDGR